MISNSDLSCVKSNLGRLRFGVRTGMVIHTNGAKIELGKFGTCLVKD